MSAVTTVSHPDPCVLERELLDRVVAAKARDPLAALLVVVPTTRLADHVLRRIAVRLGAAIGIDVVTHRTLALRILAAAGRPARVADSSIEDALLERVLDRAPRHRVRDFVRERPVARPSLLATLSDLRDAGVDPKALPASELRDLYARWTDAWRSLSLLDEAGLAVAATPYAGSFGSRYAAILHHGAYELIGVHEDLVRALGEGVTLRPSLDDGSFPDLTGKDLRLTHVQGSRAELMRAASSVLARIAGGAAPEEQAIVVRSFGPYASAVEALLLDDGIPWHTSFASSLRRVRRIAEALEGIGKDVDRPAARWPEHAEAFAAKLPDHARIEEILAAMRSLDADLGDTREVPAAEAAAFLTARIDAATIAPEGSDGGGPRLLDAMQARGMTFEHVALVGMNAGIWPRIPREDPFLSDELRRRLRAETGRPVPIRLDNDGEERLLLAMTLGSARRSIDVSWRRADDHGRPVVKSLALREISRDAGALLPAHPLSRLETLAGSPGVLRPEDELVLVALSAESGADGAAAVRDRRPELAPGVAWVAMTDSFDPRDLAYDGRVGAPREPRALSVSQLETLSKCPLQFFFEHRLKIEPIDRVESPYEPSRMKLGLLVHDALREVYERLAAEDGFDAPLTARVERATELLRQAWAERAGEFAASRARPLPIVDRVESELWLRSLLGFVADDLARMDRENARPVAFESDRRTTDTAPELPALKARLDRIVEGPAGRVVGDYKTGGKVDRKVGAGGMLKGENLQVAVYALIEGVPVDLLGVGRDQDERFARFDGFTPALRDGIVETIHTVVALDAAGTYPMSPGQHCAWCAFGSACRRGHPPSRFRGEEAADALDLRDTRKKGTRKPTLAAVRGAKP